MDKINYNQHDWNKGEVIKEENLDNMENGIKQATNKINEIIDTEQDFQDRMTDIDGRIDINNEELVIARDGCDNLGQRIERDQQYIYNILNDGSYLEFNGTDITVDNSKEGYTSNMVIKGQTYQNLIIPDIYSNQELKIRYTNKQREIKQNITYTFINTSNLDIECDINKSDSSNAYITTVHIPKNSKKTYVFENGTSPYVVCGVKSDGWDDSKKDLLRKSIILLEGDWTNKEVPSSITGIESVGEKEGNKISILTHNKNLIDGSFYLNKPFKNVSAAGSNSGVGARVKIDTSRLKPNITYTVITKFNDGTLLSNDYTLLRFFDETLSSSKNYALNSDFTLDKAYPYCDIYWNSQGGYDDKEISEFMIVESTVTDKTYVKHKEDKKEILIALDGGLKSLPNGTCDTIEQRDDGVYLVQRIEKVAYAEGDENLDNCITDKTISYKAKATPVETQLDLDMSKWLTYQGVTYFTTTCNVQPTLSLKAPVDIQATVSNLQATNLSLRRNNQQLEQENQQAEKELNTLQEQCDQQTADLLDMDMRVLMLEE